MPIDKLVPSANAAGGALATNDYTLIDETVASADGSINPSIADDWATATATWSLTDLSQAISSVNSATFRVRARVVCPSNNDDVCTYRFRLTVGGSTYDINWIAPTDNNAGFADRSISVGTFTDAQYNAASVELSQIGYSKTKGNDGFYIEVDALELEVDYVASSNRTVTCTTEAISLSTNNSTVNRARNVSSQPESLVVTVNPTIVTRWSEQIGYADASVSGPTDGEGVWTNEANAYDGSLATFATTTTGDGTQTFNELRASGNTLTATYDSIINLYVRVFQEVTTSTGTHYIYGPDGFSFITLIDSFLTDGWSKESNIPDPVSGYAAQSDLNYTDIHYSLTASPVDLQVAKTEFRVEYLPGAVGTKYDFNKTGFVDAQGVWTDETNINNSFTQFAALQVGNNGSNSNNALVLHGTNAPSSGGQIVDVYIRTGFWDADYATIYCEVWTDGKAELLYSRSVTNNSGEIRPPYFRIPPPAGGWTWNILQNLELYVWADGYVSGTTGARLYLAQLKVFTSVQAGRNVSCTTESILFTRNNASINRERGVNTSVEALTLTENQATVSRVRNVAGTPEVLILAEGQATIALNRTVLGSSEILQLVENQATIVSGKNVSGITEQLQVVENNTNINRGRGVLGSIEQIQLAENQATVNRERGVLSATEQLLATENPASINRERGVLSATEQLLVIENQATVSGGFRISCQTEVLQVSENPTSINRERGVIALTEQIQVSESAATAARVRNVAGTTETLQVIETASSINRARGIIGLTELLQVAESQATVLRGNVIQCFTENVQISESNALINRERGVIGLTEQLQVIENSAVVYKVRNVSGISELVQVSENSATVNKGRGVVGQTEFLQVSENQALIQRGSVISCVTEILQITENFATVNRGFVLQCSPEGISLSANIGSINRALGIEGTTELLLVDENQAVVSRGNVIACLTENVEVVVNSSTVNRGFNVSGAIEHIIVEGFSSINRSRGVIGVTETIEVNENLAVVQKAGIVFCFPERVEVTINQGAITTVLYRATICLEGLILTNVDLTGLIVDDVLLSGIIVDEINLVGKIEDC